MATAAQIIARACAKASVPNFTTQALIELNIILSDLCQNFDFDAAKGTTVFNLNPSLTTTAIYPNITPGEGPYPLPEDFLRMVDEKDAMWFLDGVPYPMIPCDLSEYDGLVQQAGLTGFPYILATDMSQSPPNLVIYPPPSGGFQAMIRYRRQMPDITDTSKVPWFPNQGFLLKALTARMMEDSDDDRQSAYENVAKEMLTAYLKMKDDATNRVKTVKLDRRRFRPSFATLAQTKLIGW